MSDPASTPPVRKGRGCLFYGCLTSLVLLLIAGLLAFFAVRAARNWIAGFTDAAPMKLPKVEMAEPEYEQLQARVKSFGDALEKGQPDEPLVLSERDINALLARAMPAKELADKFYIALEGDQVKGQVSIPLPSLGWFGRGRYLNGDASFNVSLQNGLLLVTAREVRVKGRPLPDPIMSQLRRENLAKDVYKDLKDAEAIGKFESIRVEDGQVIIRAREPKL